MRNAFKNGGNGGNWWPLSPDGPVYGIVPTTGGGVRYEMPWAFALRSIGYTILQYYDPPMDRVLTVLLPASLIVTPPAHPARDSKGRNWGIFIFNMQPTSFHVIEVPHPKADDSTELEGVEAFEASDTLALFIASEDRFAINHPTGTTHLSHAVADVAHAHTFPAPFSDTTSDGYSLQSGFEAAHEAMIDVLKGRSNSAIVQLHGYVEGSTSEGITKPADSAGRLKIANAITDCASTTPANACDLANNIIANLPKLAEDGSFNPNDGSQPAANLPLTTLTAGILEADTNSQGKRANDNGIHFLHVEADQAARSIAARSDTGTTDPNLRPFLAQEVMYAVDDWIGVADIGIASGPTRSPDFACDLTTTTNPLLGFDNNENPDSSSGGLRVDSTMIALKRKSNLSFVGYQLSEDPYLGISTSSDWSWHLHRERINRAGWQVYPLWIDPPTNTTVTGVCPTTPCDINSTDGTKGADATNGAPAAYAALKREGFGPDATIILDFEQSAPVGTGSGKIPNGTTYIHDWFNWWKTTGNNAVGYKLGIYCSTLNCDSIRSYLETTFGTTWADGSVVYWEYNANCKDTGSTGSTTGLKPTRNTWNGSPGCIVPASTDTTSMAWVDPGKSTTLTYATMWQYAQTTGSNPSGQGEIDGCFTDNSYGYATPFESTDPTWSGGSTVDYVCHLAGGTSLSGTFGYGDYTGYDFFADLDSIKTPCSTGGSGSASWYPKLPRRFVRDQTVTLTQNATTLYNCVSNSQQCNQTSTASAIGWSTNEVANAVAMYQNGGSQISNYTLIGQTWYSNTLVNPRSINNGGFETNSLSGWTSTGSTSVIAGGGPVMGAAYAAQVGSTNPSTDSTLAQTFVVPSSPTTLYFQYKIVCQDTISFDQVWATLYDANTQATYTILPQTCTNTGAWATAELDASGIQGHQVTLTFHVHDDNHPNDATYAYFDTVVFHAPPANGDFESATLAGWSSTGTTSVVANTAWDGNDVAQVGSTSPTTDNTLAQTFTIPSGATYLSFGTNIVCPDSITYDQVWVTLYDSATQTTSNVLPQTCTNTGTWSGTLFNVSAMRGHSVTLTLHVHDDNYPGDPTYAQFDGIVML